jgi:hypothetical protein
MSADDPIRAADLRWTLDDDDAPLERVDVLTLDSLELSHYARELQQDNRWLRALLHAALALLQRMTTQLRAARLTIREVRRRERVR